MDMKPTNDNQE